MNVQYNRDRVKAKQAEYVANAAFFLLFPGFFFYHTLLGTGATSAFLGGYFSPISLIFVVPLAVVSMRLGIRIPKITSVGAHYFIFLIYFLLVVICNALAGANSAIIVNHLLCILFMMNAFIIFTLIDFSSLHFRRIAFFSLACMTSIAFYYSVDGVFYLGALGMAKDADSLATYQGFARSYLVTCLPLIAFTRSALLRLVIYVISAFTLFINTARSEFAALLFLIPVIEFYFSKQKLFLFTTMLLILFFANIYKDELISALPATRIMELLDLSHSTSANKRYYLSMYALQTIAQHPVLGDYASYAPGYYSHNILSAWVDLGIFGFIYLIALLFLPVVSMATCEYFSARRDNNFILGFTLICCTIFLLLTSHNFTDMLIGSALGAYTQYRFRRKHGQYRSSDVGASEKRHQDIFQTVPQHGAART